LNKHFRLHIIMAACLMVMAWVCAFFDSRLLAASMIWASGGLAGFIFAEVTARDLD
jgi:hypothetical protein